MATNPNMQARQNAGGRMQSSNPQMGAQPQRPTNTGVVGPQRMPQRPMGPGGGAPSPSPWGQAIGGLGAGMGGGMGPKPPMPMGPGGGPQMPQMPMNQTGAGPMSNVSDAQQRQNWLTMQRGAIGGLGGQTPQAPPPPTPMQMTPAALGTAQASAQQALQRNMGAMQSIAPQAAPGPQTPQGLNPNILAALQQRRGF